jgi:Divergent InlB B-repeat domain/Thrombospondin type 3 repeat
VLLKRATWRLTAFQKTAIFFAYSVLCLKRHTAAWASSAYCGNHLAIEIRVYMRFRDWHPASRIHPVFEIIQQHCVQQRNGVFTVKIIQLLRILTLLALASLVAGCKLEVVAIQGGGVSYGPHPEDVCAEGRNCVLEITELNYAEPRVFTAIPKPGYEFVKWQKGEGFLCGGSTNPTCTVTLPENPDQARAITALFVTARVMPVYNDVGFDPDGDGTRNEVDADDDGDGVLDVDDECADTVTGAPVGANGCAVVADADGDGVADGDDNCPAAANADQFDITDDGQGDACDDSDGDGTLDVFDTCPLNSSTCLTPIDVVEAGGKVWAQPDRFQGGVSWEQLEAVCLDGLCRGTLNGFDMTGWKWAARPDFIELLVAFGTPPPVDDPLLVSYRPLVYPGDGDTTVIPAMLSVFRTTFSNAEIGHLVVGYMRYDASDLYDVDVGVRTAMIGEMLADQGSYPGGYFGSWGPVAPVLEAEGSVGAWFFKEGPPVPDADGDRIADATDNCPATGNFDQVDINEDGQGDACDDSDGDGALDSVDTCPLNTPACLTGADFVVAGDKVWAQPDLFKGAVSWNDINAACPGGLCRGLVNGHDMTGWTWASWRDMGYLMWTYGAEQDYGGSLGLNSDLLPSPPLWVAAMFEQFRPTLGDEIELTTAGLVRVSWLSEPRASLARITENFDNGYYRASNADRLLGLDDRGDHGAWFYKQAP